MRWYVVPAVGVPVGMAAAYAFRRGAIIAFVRSWLGGPPVSPENYIQFSMAFNISDMDMESARKVADSLKPRSITPVYDPPALQFTFNPIHIPTKFIEFRWQPPPYRHELFGRPSRGAIRRLAESAYKTLYKTKIERMAGGSGWTITLLAEVPL